MTNNIDVLGQMRTEWQYTGKTSASRRAMTSFDRDHPDLCLGGLIDLWDLVLLLEQRGGRTALERAKIIQTLLEDASSKELQRALVQTLIPGVVSTCRQLRFGEGIISDPGEMVSMGVALCSELISEWSGQSRPYAGPDLLSALRGRLRRWMLKEKDAQRVLSLYESADSPAPDPSALLTRLECFRGSQYERIAALTYERVFEGRSLKEVAKHDHSSPAMLQQELQQFAVNFLI